MLERKLQTLFWAFRRKKTNYLLTALIALFLPAYEYLNQQKDLTGKFPWLPYLPLAATIVCVLYLTWRVFRTAPPPPPPPGPPLPAAIKGLLPFSFADGELYQGLGRRAELSTLLAFAGDSQTSISVVRGESGAGKTSLLQAGLRYYLLTQKPPVPCVYWEATPSNPTAALLRAIQSELPDTIAVHSLDDLPQPSCPRWVLILDQFEQLRRNIPDHVPVFAFLERLVLQPPPHQLSVIIGFRREYDSEWLDFEYALRFRAEKLPVNLLSRPAAEDAMATLSSAAGFTLEQALVTNFIATVATDQGVSPVDLAIGLLTLSNRVQQTGRTDVTAAEYQLAGGAEGLLLAYVQDRLQEVPESIRAGLLRGLIFTLVDPSTSQRKAEGAGLEEIASKAELPVAQLEHWLDRLAHPRIRLLEKIAGADELRYRLQHERLIPVLRRLTGAVLAQLDQTRLLFQDRFGHWKQTGSSQYLLRGEDLRRTQQFRDALLPGADAAQRIEYFRASIRRRSFLRAASLGAIGAAISGGSWLLKLEDDRLQETRLASWGLPSWLFQAQHQIDGLRIPGFHLNDLSWLRSNRLTELWLSCQNLHSLAGLEKAKKLRVLVLESVFVFPKDLIGPKDLVSITLSGLRFPSSIELERLKSIAPVTISRRVLSGPSSDPNIEELKRANSVNLDLTAEAVFGFQEGKLGDLLTRLRDLPAVTLTLEAEQLDRYQKEIGELEGHTSLVLQPGFGKPVPFAKIKDEVAGLKRLRSVALFLDAAKIPQVREVEDQERHYSLTLNFSIKNPLDLNGVENFKTVDTFGFDFSSTDIKNPADFDLSLERIDRIPPAIPVELRIHPRLVVSASKLRTKARVSLWVKVYGASLPAVPQGFKFIGLEF